MLHTNVDDFDFVFRLKTDLHLQCNFSVAHFLAISFRAFATDMKMMNFIKTMIKY